MIWWSNGPIITSLAHALAMDKKILTNRPFVVHFVFTVGLVHCSSSFLPVTFLVVFFSSHSDIAEYLNEILNCRKQPIIHFSMIDIESLNFETVVLSKLIEYGKKCEELPSRKGNFIYQSQMLTRWIIYMQCHRHDERSTFLSFLSHFTIMHFQLKQADFMWNQLMIMNHFSA